MILTHRALSNLLSLDSSLQLTTIFEREAGVTVIGFSPAPHIAAADPLADVQNRLILTIESDGTGFARLEHIFYDVVSVERAAEPVWCYPVRSWIIDTADLAYVLSNIKVTQRNGFSFDIDDNALRYSVIRIENNSSPSVLTECEAELLSGKVEYNNTAITMHKLDSNLTNTVDARVPGTNHPKLSYNKEKSSIRTVLQDKDFVDMQVVVFDVHEEPGVDVRFTIPPHSRQCMVGLFRDDIVVDLQEVSHLDLIKDTIDFRLLLASMFEKL